MNMKNKLKQKSQKLKTDIPAVFLALRHKDTPFAAKTLALITVMYALSPVDLVPDFIPVLGYLDDLIILPALVAATIKLIPAEVLRQCRKESENMWKDRKPKKWYYALPIVMIWLLIAFVIIKAIWF